MKKYIFLKDSWCANDDLHYGVLDINEVQLNDSYLYIFNMQGF